MNVFQILYTILIQPLQLFFEYVFSVAQKGTQNPGLSIIALSMAMNLLVLPLYKRADEVQEAERDIENKLKDGVAHIRKTFKGDEKMMMLQTYYRQNGYKPTDVFKGSVSLLLEIPFFIAAYQFLSHLTLLNGVTFGPIADLGTPDALIKIGVISINILPILMTLINVVSSAIFTKGYPLRTKIQLYAMAAFFLVFLYKSPSGLVFYWTLNNLFSLVKTIYFKSAKLQKVMNIMFAAFGVLLILSVPLIRIKITGSKSFLLIVILFAFVCALPLLISLLKKKKKEYAFFEKHSFKEDYVIFLSGGIYLTILLGILIPSSVISSSVDEFIDMYNFKTPVWFIVSSACIALGAFVVWFGIFYALCRKNVRIVFNFAIWLASALMTVNYMVFGKNRAVLNSSLGFTEEVVIPRKEMLINLAVLFGAFVLFAALFYLIKNNIRYALIVLCLATFGISVFNLNKIVKETADCKERLARISDEMPTCTLSKDGKNVMVIMLDKAPGVFMPYFVNEKPELKEMFSGFTYYPNTVSFGAYTNVGSPAIFGGYEYTPEEMNKRNDMILVEKHNEALKVLPTIFDANGYDVTVCDAPYANYQWIPDLSIFADNPDIKTYLTKGYFWEAHQDSVSDRNYRNFFCYSLMKTAPYVLQKHLYNDGFYNENMVTNDFVDEMTNGNGQRVISEMKAQGILNNFMWDYATLKNLNTMTDVKDDDSYNFFVLENDTTHDPLLLQEPEYDIAYDIDNTAYEAEHSDRYTVDGVTLNMGSLESYEFYQTNMAAMLALGRWFDHLKEEGVYDNTRIIITADHGRALHLNDMYHIDDGSDELFDIEAYYPILLIKDFDAKEFSVSEEFMTNADVPTYALEGLVEDPVNPYTGKPINNDEKFAHPQNILGSRKWVVDDNNGYEFLPGLWLSVEGDMRDKNNWKVIKDERGKDE